MQAPSEENLIKEAELSSQIDASEAEKKNTGYNAPELIGWKRGIRTQDFSFDYHPETEP